MRIYRHKRGGVPQLNTASMPDLIFTVLFFFMIVTHMRKVTLKVQYKMPQGTELTRLTKKTAGSYIHIGKPFNTPQHTVTSSTGRGQESVSQHIQLNDKIARIEEIAPYIVAERERMNPADLPNMTVSIKADRNTNMGLITDVKQQLRRANALRINYSATETSAKRP